MATDSSTQSASDQPTKSSAAFNRREFLTYTWGVALALLTMEATVVSYHFLVPRWPIGKFGGKFTVDVAKPFLATNDPPQYNPEGQYWLVNTVEGIKAFYGACPHMGYPYKWDKYRDRFICPSHGARFTREGHYVEGPSARSLDQFKISVLRDGRTIAKTEEAAEVILSPAIGDEDVQIIVNTGKSIMGRSSELSPARYDVWQENETQPLLPYQPNLFEE